MEEFGFDDRGTRDSNNGYGTGTRRRRRTRAEVEAENGALRTQEVLDDLGEQVTKEGKAGSAKQIARDLSMLLTVFFAALATLRGSYWAKSPDQCDLLAEPLAAYIKSRKGKYGKKIAEAFLPMAIFAGFVQVFGEPLKIEYQRLTNGIRSPGMGRQTPRNQGSATYPQTDSSFAGQTGNGQYPEPDGFIPAGRAYNGRGNSDIPI